MKEAISDQPEKNASFSLNTDDLKYLFIKRLQNQGFEDHEQVKNVLHNIKLDISIQDYHLIRFSFEPDTPITDTNRKNMIYNLLNQICERYSGQELFSLDEKRIPSYIQHKERSSPLPPDRSCHETRQSDRIFRYQSFIKG